MAILDGSVVNLALVSIGRDFGTSLAALQWIVSGYLLSLGALILLAGAIADRFGRERVMLAGLIGFGVTSLICGLAPTVHVLIVARIVQGMAGAFLVPSSLAMIVAAFSGAAQGRAIGLWTAWTSAAGLLSPLVGGVLVDALTWRAVFWVNLPPMIAAALILSRLPRTHSGTESTLDWPSAALAASGLGLLVFGLIELSAESAQDGVGSVHTWVLACLAGGVAVLAAFVRRQTRVTHPMIPPSIIRIPNVAAGNVATAFIYGAMSLGFFALPLYLQSVAGFSALASGLMTLPPTVLLLLGSGTVGRRSGVRGPRWFMAGGALLCAAGFTVMGTTTSPASALWPVLIGVLLYGLGLMALVAPLTSSVLESLPPEQAGIGSSINNAAARIAGLLTVAFAGLVHGRRRG
jgi:EmrB/QacA subfamily drug resistance transporter